MSLCQDQSGSETVSQLLKKTTCSNDELYVYLSKQAGLDAAEAFVKNGTWPSGVQIPKNSSVLNPDGSINWSKAPKGGYTFLTIEQLEGLGLLTEIK